MDGGRLGARLTLAAVALSVATLGQADGRFSLTGNLKTRLLVNTYPVESLFRDLVGSSALDADFDARFNAVFDSGPWNLQADGQLIALYGDTLELTAMLPSELQALFGRLPGDDRRLLDLTAVLDDQGDFAALARLDRLSAGYTGDRGTVRIGRQALSWGNGLIYTPLDIFNPFDPAAVDREFKSGDDMLYGQLARDNGDDLQGVMVFRRDLVSGDFESAASSLALKYHGLAGAGEYDIVVSEHFDDPLLGVGGNHAIGGAVWSGDLVATLGKEETTYSAVTGLTYSWTCGGRNFSGVAEYFYNGFGLGGGDYSTDQLAANPELLNRLARGELFTLGRHYLAASALIEITPLFNLTPSAFVNLRDPSALLQITTQNDLAENLVLLGALSFPVGSAGTEFGGLQTSVPERFLSNGPRLFVQLAWYF